MSLRPFRDINRRKTKVITVGNVKVGGSNPITVQSMTNTLTKDSKATIKQINEIVNELSLDAVLELSHLVPEDVCMIASTTMTGVGIPTVPHKLLSQLDFPESLIKIPMFGLACNGGTHVIQIADEFFKANPNKVAICLTNDLCSMNLNPEDSSLTTVFGITIFGDGVSAILMLVMIIIHILLHGK